MNVLNTQAIQTLLEREPLVLMVSANEGQGVLIRAKPPLGLGNEVFRVTGETLGAALFGLADECEARNANQQEPR